MKQGKAEELAEIYGLTIDEMLHMFGTDSVMPAICTMPGCSYTDELEPDCREGECQNCGKNSVVSFLVLLDMI